MPRIEPVHGSLRTSVDIPGCRPMRGVARAPRSTRGPPRDREAGRRANLRSSSRTNSAANLQCVVSSNPKRF
jgi:hypothetical protein